MSPGRTHVLRLVGPIGDHRPSVTLDEVDRAIAPRSRVDDGLLVSLEHGDGTEELYTLGARAIAQKVPGFLEHRVGASETNHLSIFGFAPMPLLMLLGRTIGDKQPAEVYERHRHTDSWCWDPDGPPLEWITNFPAHPVRGRAVALLLSVSATVDVGAVGEVLGGDFDVVELTLPEPRRVPNVVRTRAHLRGFAEQWRSTLNRIRSEYGPSQVNLFPAAPLSVCVELGRRLLPKADPELVVFDRFGARFCRALSLRGPEVTPSAPPASSTASPGRPTRGVSWRVLLHQLFVHGFENHELLWRLGILQQGIETSLPSTEVSNDKFATQVMKVLERRGLIDDELFRNLREHFPSPQRRAEIDAIQDAWRKES
ncbi:SAVED domain-containing protein [Nannocystis sp. ILAH1]|uniref:SAVED domain-containing protein n=1 Tax=unclassified Nannocystis TaxID=2627009 RepID=UPI002270DA89|nr:MULTISPECIES: SAVED domain-containing protein [unclassified Nannocystis]MCY0995070.1 SAVED domain-containing protein [Nannocystis sp. ILAH1]MCY1069744.1 SAVED domain-containing protein [Nannocystis sp. RBIL2]